MELPVFFVEVHGIPGLLHGCAWTDWISWNRLKITEHFPDELRLAMTPNASFQLSLPPSFLLLDRWCRILRRNARKRTGRPHRRYRNRFPGRGTTCGTGLIDCRGTSVFPSAPAFTSIFGKTRDHKVVHVLHSKFVLRRPGPWSGSARTGSSARSG